MPVLISWLSARQYAPEGGFSGRTNKLVDGCYSHWVGGCWPLIEAALGQSGSATPTEHARRRSLYSREGLIRYILSCCQAEVGGLRDKPSTLVWILLDGNVPGLPDSLQSPRRLSLLLHVDRAQHVPTSPRLSWQWQNRRLGLSRCGNALDEAIRPDPGCSGCRAGSVRSRRSNRSLASHLLDSLACCGGSVRVLQHQAWILRLQLNLGCLIVRRQRTKIRSPW